MVVGNTLHGSVSLISDLDNLMDANGNVIAGADVSDAITNAHYQWQYADAVSGNWVDYAGATCADFVVTPTSWSSGTRGPAEDQLCRRQGLHRAGVLGSLRLTSLPCRPPAATRAPSINAGTQFNGIGNTTAVAGQAFDFFTPLTSIFNDAQTTPDLLIYTATLASGALLSTVGLQFGTLPGVLAPPGGLGAPLAGEFSTLPGATLNTVGPIAVRVKATDAGGLSVTNTFTINVQSPNAAPVAVNDTYTAFKSVALTTLPSQGVLANDSDANQDPFTAILVNGPTHALTTGPGAFHLNADGTFVYTSVSTFTGVDTFTYQDVDSVGAVGNIATVTINVLAFDLPPVVSALAETTTTLEDTKVTGTLLPGTDVDGPVFAANGTTPILTYSIVAGSATNGTVTLVAARRCYPRHHQHDRSLRLHADAELRDQHGWLADLGCAVRWTGNVPIPAERQWHCW